MSNQKFAVLQKCREFAATAVQQGVRTPGELKAWFLSNGYPHDLPTHPTLIQLLHENGVEYDPRIKQWVK